MTPWVRAIGAPIFAGFAAGCVAASVYFGFGLLECRGFRCLVPAIVVLKFGPPTLVVAAGYGLRAIGTPRAWPISIAGGVLAVPLVYMTSGLIDAVPVLLVTVSTAGFACAAMVIGPLAPIAARVAVCALLVATVPASSYAHDVKADRELVARLQASGIPLLAVDLPDYPLQYAQAGSEHYVLSYDGFSMTGRVLPADFPSGSQVRPGLWRRISKDWVVYELRRGGYLYTVQGPIITGDEVFQQAASSLRPITAREVVSALP